MCKGNYFKLVFDVLINVYLVKNMVDKVDVVVKNLKMNVDCVV